MLDASTLRMISVNKKDLIGILGGGSQKFKIPSTFQNNSKNKNKLWNHWNF